ncbi:MAG: hypothetical protein ACRDSH_00275 [Pseudonocardiaceae bacterium]
MSREVSKIPPKQNQPENLSNEQAYTNMSVPRRVCVKGMEGINATVVVTVVQDAVWLSISPPFTWEAIMAPGKVDELVHVLELARDEARKMAAARGRRTGKANALAITRSTANQ